MNSYIGLGICGLIGGIYGTVHFVTLARNEKDKRIKMQYKLYIDACEKGHLEYAQEVRQMPDFNPNTIEYDCKGFILDVNVDRKAFRRACLNGHLHVAQWIYSLKTFELYDVHDFYILNDICENNQYDILKWVHSLNVFKNKTISSVFCNICKYGNLDMAKLLYTLCDANIYDLNCLAFQMACQRDNLEVAQYLHSLNPAIYKNNSGFLYNYSINMLEGKNEEE